MLFPDAFFILLWQGIFKKTWWYIFFQRNFGEFEIPRDLIDRGEKLGSGSFGTVYSGIYHSPNDGDIECAIKEAKNEELGDNMREKLLDEAYIMRCVLNYNKKNREIELSWEKNSNSIFFFFFKLNSRNKIFSVKSISRMSFSENFFRLNNHINIFFNFNYRTIETSHVVRLIGVVTNQFPQYVILEFMEKGDLKRYLMGLRKKPPRQAVSFWFFSPRE